MELPIVYQQNMKALLGDGYAAYEESFTAPRYFGLRTNRKKISPETLAGLYKEALMPIPWIDNGFFYDGKDIRPAKHPYYYAGLYYLQEPSAMTPANRIPIEPGDKVLDICAAPGGKSTELGARLGTDGLLFSNDISNSRAQALLKNIELFGIGHVVVASEAPYKLAAKLPHYFDKILIDAPCSGEGMFRKDQAVMKAWTPDSNDKFSALQRQILDFCMQMLKPGGMILYSTCTFCPKENEESISYVLDNYPEMKLVDILPYEGFGPGLTAYGNQDPSLEKCVRIWPQNMSGEGHFVACLQSTAEPTEGGFVPYKRETTTKQVEKCTELWDFLKHIQRSFDPERIEIRSNGNVLYLPEGIPNLDGIRLMRCGLLLGEIKKNRFEPSQALAMNLTEEEFDNVISYPADDPMTLKYLKGETIELPEGVTAKDGYALVCVDHFPLGFAKVSGNSVKNKYLPGWRWQ